jgi:glyoxylase-like metal-dependent hydrolase (beta-lactamase superfamily II)
MSAPKYEVFALRYATHAERRARENFIFHDEHDTPMPMDFFVWAIRGAGRTIVVDTGYGTDAAGRRNRQLLRRPIDALLQIGIDAAEVPDVVLTHLHWDHAGGLDLFPSAMFHLQDAEMAFSTGRCMCHPIFRRPLEVEDVVAAVRLVYADRVRFHAGTAEIAPGVSLHLIGGHSGGLQAVRVRTARGWVVLASDAAHYWANIRGRAPFPLVVDVARMVEGYRVVEELSDGPDHIIPGHDPLVLSRFPPVAGADDVVRLDLPPLATS